MTPGLAWAGGNNQPPIAADDQALNLGITVAVDVLANDVEPDGEAVEIVAGDPGSCTGVVAEDFGLVTFTPTGGIAETCSFTYSLMDEQGEPSNVATVALVGVQGIIFADGFESGDTSVWAEVVP